ncbi:hypothetical protein [Blastococcus haudaquaticus]|uniref:Uncharacterized protein n=1 Tax=Blastococcus haudaquaticus TaxID=1938745 RepID=A0A286GI71_9ACTN|nr:hypothetical protein [Blastococcus haudaquaticus]SOD94664.1 hypothetical protein SAMN06272739_0951 [Blastococcus haudaquaticus]
MPLEQCRDAGLPLEPAEAIGHVRAWLTNGHDGSRVGDELDRLLGLRSW